MNTLQDLSALGLTLPSPAYLTGSILFGVVGWITFRRGRKTSVGTLTWAGLALMLFPYAVSETWMLWALGAALCGWVYFKWSE